ATTTYEILEVGHPVTGHGVAVDLYVATDTPRDDVAGIARATRAGEEEVYACARISTDDQGQRTFQHQFPPAAGKSGRLRLTRQRREVTYWAAEGEAGEFKELCRYDLGPEDVTAVRVAAFPGYAKNL